MRRDIVEGDDYSVLPVPVVRLVKWLRARLGRRKAAEPPAANDDTAG